MVDNILYFLTGAVLAFLGALGLGDYLNQPASLGQKVEALSQTGYNSFKVNACDADPTKLIAYADKEMAIVHFSTDCALVPESVIVYDKSAPSAPKTEHVARSFSAN